MVSTLELNIIFGCIYIPISIFCFCKHFRLERELVRYMNDEHHGSNNDDDDREVKRARIISNLIVEKIPSSNTLTPSPDSLSTMSDIESISMQSDDLDTSSSAPADKSSTTTTTRNQTFTTQRHGDEEQQEDDCYIDNEQFCVICLGEYKSDQDICKSHNLECEHVYHLDCMVEWLMTKHDECPICRAKYLVCIVDEHGTLPPALPPPDSVMNEP